MAKNTEQFFSSLPKRCSRTALFVWLFAVIDVLCIIHYAVILHILSPIHSVLVCCCCCRRATGERKQKIVQISLKTVSHFSFSSIFLFRCSLKSAHSTKFFRVKPGDVFLYCLLYFLLTFSVFSSLWILFKPCDLYANEQNSTIIILNMCKK